jgi:tRNA dimethylallyltransferase
VPLSRWHAEHQFGDRPYEALVIGLARPTAELDARIAARAQAMVDAGFLDEVRALATRGVTVDAVGYREMRACVEGRTDLATALAATIRATRRFARRQRTWFRREPDVVWRHPDDDAAAIAAAAAEFVAGPPGRRAARA